MPVILWHTASYIHAKYFSDIRYQTWFLCGRWGKFRAAVFVACNSFIYMCVYQLNTDCVHTASFILLFCCASVRNATICHTVPAAICAEHRGLLGVCLKSTQPISSMLLWDTYIHTECLPMLTVCYLSSNTLITVSDFNSMTKTISPLP